MIVGHLMLGVLGGLLSAAVFVRMGQPLWSVVLSYCLGGLLSIAARLLIWPWLHRTLRRLRFGRR